MNSPPSLLPVIGTTKRLIETSCVFRVQYTGVVHKIRKIPVSVKMQLSAACRKHSLAE